MDALTKELISLHGKEGLRVEQWFDHLIDDVLAGFGLRLTDIPSEAVREAIFDLSALYAREVHRTGPFEDLLGVVHMELVSKYQQQGSGQFFTPPSVCRLMARLNIGTDKLPGDRLTRICDPAVGAGGLMLAASEHIFLTHGAEALAWVSLTGIDIDRRCARMYPCQILASLHLHQLQLGELISYHGNTLGDPADWQTVCHYSRRDLPEPVVPADLPEVKRSVATAAAQISTEALSDQLSLF